MSTKLIDVSNGKFGKLTVLKRSKKKVTGAAMWDCRCDCGNLTTVSGADMRSGRIISCGCAHKDAGSRRIINIIGKKFGRLTVLSRVEGIGKSRAARYSCLCDCGKVHEVNGRDLRYGHSKSCGCLKKDMAGKASINPDSGFNKLYRTYKSCAKFKKREFLITKEEFRKITSSECFYCGTKPKAVSCKCSTDGIYLYNGIDRKNNNVGYITNNCVACCTTCNFLKSNMEFNDFMATIVRIYNHISTRCDIARLSEIPAPDSTNWKLYHHHKIKAVRFNSGT